MARDAIEKGDDRELSAAEKRVSWLHQQFYISPFRNKTEWDKIKEKFPTFFSIYKIIIITTAKNEKYIGGGGSSSLKGYRLVAAKWINRGIQPSRPTKRNKTTKNGLQNGLIQNKSPPPQKKRNVADWKRSTTFRHPFPYVRCRLFSFSFAYQRKSQYYLGITK